MTTSFAPAASRTPRFLTADRAALGCALTLAVLGLAVLAGWMFRVESLMAVLPGHVRMKPNAGCCFIASGLALAARTRCKSSDRGVWWWVVVVAALFPLLIGSATLVEYFGGVNLGLDQLLFRDPQARVFPGRMASISAICFCLSSLSLLLHMGRRRARQISQAFALVIVLAAFSAIVGSLYGTSVLYGAMQNSAMALHTGVGFLLLGTGLLLASPESRLMRLMAAEERGGMLARRSLAAVVVVPVLLGWVYLLPAMDFGQVRFAMALFAMTLTVASAAMLWFVATFLNRVERQHAEFSRRQAQSAERVARSELELRMVTDRLPILLSYVDSDSRFVRVNRTYEVWTGRGAGEILGRTIAEVLGEEYAARSREPREAAFRGVESVFETTYPTAGGERQVRVTYAPDLDGAGAARGLVCMVQDIEDQRRAELALRQTEKLAAVGRLAASIAHEINNPLESVTNLLYLARNGANLAEVHGFLDVAEVELRRVSIISNQTLRFNKQSTRPLEVRCDELFESTLSIYQGRLLNARVTVQKRQRATVPVLCFDNEIRQVLSNLVANAIDAMHPGGGFLMLRSREATNWATGGRGLVLTVADTGAGMSPAVQKKIFEAFFTTKGMNGTGLGLWVSQEILERHDGSLRARTSQRTDRHGTVFQLFLPFNATVRRASDVASTEAG